MATLFIKAVALACVKEAAGLLRVELDAPLATGQAHGSCAGCGRAPAAQWRCMSNMPRRSRPGSSGSPVYDPASGEVIARVRKQLYVRRKRGA